MPLQDEISGSENPFIVDIENILSDFEGALEEYSFEEDIHKNLFEEIVVRAPLIMDIEIVRRTYGVELRILHLETLVDVPGDGIKKHPVYLKNISREFHLHNAKEDSDDIGYIDKHDKTIDITHALEQEILISCLI